MSKWRDYLGGGDADATEGAPETEQGATEEEEPKEEAPQPSLMTADAVQAMLDRNAEQMNQHFTTLVSGLQTSLAPKQEGDQVDIPTDAEFEKALEEGNTKEFLALQRRKDVAMATILDNRVASVEAAANLRVTELQERVVESAVPEEYKAEVNSMMDDLGIDRQLRSNAKVLSLLTLAAKGKNADAEKAAALEAAKRQANLEPTGDVSGVGRPIGGAEKQEPVFSDQARQALHSVGRDGDAFAKGMGYKDWADYEAAANNLMTAEEVVTHKWMKKGKK